MTKDFGDVPIEVFSFRGEIRYRHDSELLLAQFCFAKLDNNVLEIKLSHTVTQGLASGKYVYDIEAYDEDDFVMRLFEGRATVTPEVTRYVAPITISPCAAQD